MKSINYQEISSCSKQWVDQDKWRYVCDLLEKDEMAPFKRRIKVGSYILNVIARFGAYCSPDNGIYQNHVNKNIYDYSSVEIQILSDAEELIVPALISTSIGSYSQYGGVSCYERGLYISQDEVIKIIDELLLRKK